MNIVDPISSKRKSLCNVCSSLDTSVMDHLNLNKVNVMDHLNLIFYENHQH